MMAMQGLGMLENLGRAKEWAPVDRRLQPDPVRHGVYRELFGIYEKLRDQLPERFAELAAFQRKVR